MFLSKQKLKQLIDQQKLKLEPFSKENLRKCSVKLHLGEQGYNHNPNEILDVTYSKESDKNSFKLDKDGHIINPGDFFLIKTKEKITMPEGYLGWMETRGSLAKLGIQAHLCDGHIDPGSNMEITLQIKNVGNNQVRIHPGMYAVKLYISKLSVKL
ncbi:MAG: dCTP deaminase [Candidatus Magasanikbacteria bacterium]